MSTSAASGTRIFATTSINSCSGKETLNHKTFTSVFISAEEADLFSDLHSLTRNSTLRKLNDLIKRAKLAKVNHGN